jgi:hypothetical protein
MNEFNKYHGIQLSRNAYLITGLSYQGFIVSNGINATIKSANCLKTRMFKAV